MRDLFLANATVVLSAVGDPRVANAWDDASVLEGQTVGSLASHLARGSVWVVGDYLDAAPPVGSVDFETAAEYFAAVVSGLTADGHASIRDRGAVIAKEGHRRLVGRLAERLFELAERLAVEPADRLVAIYEGKVMRLDDYLWTRLVEQVVHLDDLARSIGADPWINAPDAEALVISCGAEVGRLRFGGPAMIRTLFRDQTGALPVI